MNLMRMTLPSKPNVPELNVVGVGLLGGRQRLVIWVSTDDRGDGGGLVVEQKTAMQELA